MKDEAPRREGQLDQVQRSSTNATSIFILWMSFSLAEFDELKPCIHSITRSPEIYLSHSIDCLGRMQLYSSANDLELNQATEKPHLSSGGIQKMSPEEFFN